MNKITKFYEVKTNERKELVLLVTKVEDKETTTKKPYAAITLFDGESEQNINDFNNTVARLAERGIIKDSIVEVTVFKKENGYFDLVSCRLNTNPSITRGDFIHIAPINLDKSFEWLINQIKNVDTNTSGGETKRSISYLTLKLLKENEEAFKRSSAAVGMHHNFIGGLLYHTTRMVSAALQVCRTYSDLDKELLVCGTALHDIGKIHCYITDDIGNAKMSVVGNLFEHAYYGMYMIDEAARNEECCEERVMLLKHMIASHHGKLEWGALVVPKIKEASMLHEIDMMDSRINMFEEAYKGQEDGTMSEKKVYGLDNCHIYKPTYVVQC